MTDRRDEPPRKGRGATLNPEGRFAAHERTRVDDGWGSLDEPLPPLETEIQPESARTIVSRNRSPDLPFSQSINPYRGCEHGCVYCARGDTSVLYADGRQRPLEQVRAGDAIIGTVRAGSYRRYVQTRVLAHWSTIKPAYRITLADGTELVTSGDHRFLTERGWKFVTANEHGPERRPQLTANDSLIGRRKLAEPRPENEDYGRGYLCAMLSGDDRTSGKRSIAGLAIRSEAGLRVVNVEPLNRGERLYDITTGTGDFIANGVVSHNCYARPSHAYVDLSPGLDFETRLFYKQGAAARLSEEFRKPGYKVSPITLGANTDPYQPIERDYHVTRSILEVMRDFRHPLSIVTKSALVTRDIDLLRELASDDLVQVLVSITSLDPQVKRTLEPRTAGPLARLRTVRALADAGVPAGVIVAPVIPAITDHEIERIVAAAAEAGATHAGYVLLRLPYEVKDLFRAWLDEHYPQRAARVMNRIHEMRGGRDNDPRFGTRMRGEGPYAELIAQRFGAACRRHGVPGDGRRELRTDLFAPPARPSDQLGLFG